MQPPQKHGFARRAWMVRSLAALLTAAWPPMGVGATGHRVGLVLMHGKWDRPPLLVLPLARQLAAEGVLVETPLMPWSSARHYDVDYPQALVEVEHAAEQLRQAGATRVIVGGISFGANAGLAYAASGRAVDGIVALSPGHTPDLPRFAAVVADSVARARGMVAAGHGDEAAFFTDFNQGTSKEVRCSAAAYLSYFDPEGLGAMTRQTAALPRALPLLMAVGTADPLAQMAESAIFRKAPVHPDSQYLSLPADHKGLLQVAAPALSDWLRARGTAA